MVKIDPNKFYRFPLDIAKCPICGAAVIVGDFDEYETETGLVTESGFHIDCETEPEFDDPDYDDWFNSHWSMPYVDWLPLEVSLHQWFNRRYCLNLELKDSPRGGTVPLPPPF